MAGRSDLPPAARVPLLALGFVALVLGMAGGLARLGLPMEPQAAAAYHGALMVGGFFGTVIALERAVALGALWAYAAPLAAGMGALFLLVGRQAAGAGLLLLASVLLAAATLAVLARQRALFTVTLSLGALAWAAGNVLWLLGAPIATAVPWWIGFFVLTIAAERLELNRLLPPKPRAKALFVAIAALLLLGLGASLAWPQAGVLVLAAALAAMAVWLAINDIARRTVKGRGLPRYVAVSLLSGYAWLLAGALAIAAAGGLAGAGPLYDAALHAILLGFVFSMVFGHAPIIFPAVLRISIPYTAWLYAPLALLHVTLALRWAGDFGASPALARAGALGNASAVLLFVAVMAGTVILQRGLQRDRSA
ncbi:MAG: hypothetical protein A3G27_11095 [Betaproteobacteria bacterium RIFCSPLOWO2_12_FULL_66_14]|nr:MAG: hypothetical protein A3G27_11095 [Betaproteobacteria bacterium RIFCSPLOWO2_12_FULL_66_14]